MQEQPHWRRLLLRTEETAERYKNTIANRDKSLNINYLEDDEENVIEEYTYWKRMKNEFPYDRYFSKSDMLVLKRPVSEEEMTDEERQEYLKLKVKLSDTYDSILDHLPKQRSIGGHCHFHLIEFKRADGLPR